ncbi:MAG TPA: glutathione S-transferase N-terminal domain-containing protein [Alphaproteobacteria bacterium]|jgi:GST-like protein|nr:glutathione S-transferase N-terminal domain-containing protein [Alphaproteobacteria bacterium]
MIVLYAWPTPNAYKVSIMLEETALPYKVVPVNIMAGEQFAPDFLKISPNNRMPAIVDDDVVGGPLSVFESGAILMYLAEKTGQFWPLEPHARYKTAEWVMWQMAGLGPMLGQAGHFRRAAPEKIPYAIDRYTNESKRLFGVLDRQLAGKDYIAGAYSIADMMSYPWTLAATWLEIPMEDFPNLVRWQAAMAARPAVKRGMDLLADKRVQPSDKMDEKTREILYGKTQNERR